MDLRLSAGIVLGKTAGGLTRRMGRGGGTALPGLVAMRIDPGMVGKLGRQLAGGRVVVTGTNGKTTTSHLLAEMLRQAAVPYLHNREGSNMLRGFASMLLEEAGVGGRLGGQRTSVGLFETDEATMPGAVRALQPKVLVFTNLFRDQLDRYGEVDTVAGFWREALASAPKDSTLVLNADDPSVAELAGGWTGPVHWFGLNDPAMAEDGGGAFDARWCRVCGGSFRYGAQYFAHVGIWRCEGCGRERPEPETAATGVALGLDSAEFTVPGLGEVRLAVTGLYNVYNALAAVAAARVLGLPDAAIVGGLAATAAAFGRQEVIVLEGRRVRLVLAKNPAGANQVIRWLAALGRQGAGLRVAVLLNDRLADGQDVSWIWDVDYDVIAPHVKTAWAGGVRAEDMALRLKYAGWPEPSGVAHEPSRLLDALLAGTPAGEDVFVIPTYTAMLDLRAELAHRGAAGQFWDGGDTKHG
jgi:lipid II isoglutaminyl synthase (glutamine-hydrolysing)